MIEQAAHVHHQRSAHIRGQLTPSTHNHQAVVEVPSFDKLSQPACRTETAYTHAPSRVQTFRNTESCIFQYWASDPLPLPYEYSHTQQ